MLADSYFSSIAAGANGRRQPGDNILDAVVSPAAPMPTTAAEIRAAAEAAGTKLSDTTKAVFALADQRNCVLPSGDDREMAAGYRDIRRQTLRVAVLERMLPTAVERERLAAG